MYKRILKKAAAKLGFNKISYKLKRKRLINAKPCGMAVSDAYLTLNSHSPNPNKSCISERKPKRDFKYDLEIIIPAYNEEKHIEKCLKSVLNQKSDYNFHIICIDDGSTDDTGALIDGFSDSRLTVIHQENRGFSGARNTGIEKADGRYIMFVDSDDFLADGAVQALMQAAYNNEADIVEGSAVTCTEDGRKYKTAYKKQGRLGVDGLYGGPVAKVFKSSLFNNVLFPENFWYEDSLMRQIIYPTAKTIFGISDVVYCRRNNPRGITSTGVKKPKSVDSLWVTIRLFEDRNILGLSTTQDYYEYILRMARLTYQRTAFQPTEVKKAVFTVFADFVGNNFCGYKTEKYFDLEYSIKNKNYELFSAYCELA